MESFAVDFLISLFKDWIPLLFIIHIVINGQVSGLLTSGFGEAKFTDWTFIIGQYANQLFVTRINKIGEESGVFLRQTPIGDL